MNLVLLKVKPMPQGFWYTTKWDMIRTMRSGSEYIAVVQTPEGEKEIKTRAELLDKDITIKDEPYKLHNDGKVTKVEPTEEVVTT